MYRGTLQDGSVVAVKKLISASNFHGDAEFLNEVETISSLNHRNLVQLRGCCVSDRNIHSSGESQHLLSSEGGSHERIGKKPLTWPQRKNIILDVTCNLS